MSRKFGIRFVSPSGETVPSNGVINFGSNERRITGVRVYNNESERLAVTIGSTHFVLYPGEYDLSLILDSKARGADKTVYRRQVAKLAPGIIKTDEGRVISQGPERKVVEADFYRLNEHGAIIDDSQVVVKAQVPSIKRGHAR